MTSSRRVASQQLTIDGDKERFKELLRRRLTECGWRDQIKILCREVVKERGIKDTKVDDIVQEIIPKGRSLVPDSVKKELLQKIKTYLYEKARQ